MEDGVKDIFAPFFLTKLNICATVILLNNLLISLCWCVTGTIISLKTFEIIIVFMTSLAQG
jgi:hypothetical protein